MPKIERLSETRVAKETKAGLYADGAGLYLRIGRGGAKCWAFRYMWEKSAGNGLGGTDKS
jgi:hypothetical protein